MEIEVILTQEPIQRPQNWGFPWSGETGSLTEFYGVVRATEHEEKISALQYEAYEGMAAKVIREKISRLQAEYPCQAVRVIHRLGKIPVGESAIYVGVQSKHRREGFLFLQFFMDELKREVPIWKQG